MNPKAQSSEFHCDRISVNPVDAAPSHLAPQQARVFDLDAVAQIAQCLARCIAEALKLDGDVRNGP